MPGAAIDTFVQFAESRTSPRFLAVLEHAHATDAGEDAHHIDWTRRFHSAMDRWSSGSVYVNSLDQDDMARVPEAYANNYDRLSFVKRAYDPDNAPAVIRMFNRTL